MNLQEIRRQFISITGRYDLITGTLSSHTDNGANFYINAGQKYLDRLMHTDKTEARYFTVLEAGQFHVAFQHCRAIKEVWAINLSDSLRSRYQLDKLNMTDFRLTYVNSWGDMDQADPIHYTPALLRPAARDATATLANTNFPLDFLDVMVADFDEYNAILIGPTPQSQTAIEVIGYFYSAELSADTDESFWTRMHPNILIMAAAREVEIMYRNSEGVSDWNQAIENTFLGIDFDTVEQTSADIDQMEG